MGQEVRIFPSAVRARLTARVRGTPERRVYARVQVEPRDGELTATPLASQSSGALTSMRFANGLAVVDADVEAGAVVEVVMIGPI